MDWSNIDLNSASERYLYLINPLSFETLLLEINCNIPNITEETVSAQFEEDLTSRVKKARSVFYANLTNITKYAQEQRNND